MPQRGRASPTSPWSARSTTSSGQVAVAFVIPAPGAPADLGDQITKACAARLAGFKCPKAVYLVDEFPRATLEKVAKNKLREIADSYVDGGPSA